MEPRAGWGSIEKITQQVNEENPGVYSDERVREMATLMVLALDNHMVFEEEDFDILMKQVKSLNRRGQRRWTHRVWNEKDVCHVIVKFDPDKKILYSPHNQMPLVPITVSAAARCKGDTNVAQATIDLFNAMAPSKNEHEAYCKTQKLVASRLAKGKKHE